MNTDSYLERVEKALVQEHSLSAGDAKNLLKDSWVEKSLKKSTVYITHYRPEHWANELYQDYLLMNH
jgi:hypothetical protein